MDRLLFGDNQFFGVNHMSEEKARAQAMRFRDLDAVMAVLGSAHDQGVGTFMCTTHDRVAEIVGEVQSQPERYPDLAFYPCLPYAHKYANAVTEHGMFGAVRRFLPDEGLVSTSLRGAGALATKDVDGIITLLVDAEMTMFRDVSAPVVFLQNVVVDLLLGLGFDRALAVFDQHVRERYGAQAGFITMNLPRLLEALERVGVEEPVVCASINQAGFRMSGGVDAYIDALQRHRCRLVAMSVFASGALDPVEALRFVADFPQLESVVFGASSAANITSTVRIAQELWDDAPRRG